MGKFAQILLNEFKTAHPNSIKHAQEGDEVRVSDRQHSRHGETGHISFEPSEHTNHHRVEFHDGVEHIHHDALEKASLRESREELVEFLSGGGGGGDDDKVYYHKMKQLHHQDELEYHRSMSKTKGDAHNKAHNAHVHAALAHASAAQMHRPVSGADTAQRKSRLSEIRKHYSDSAEARSAKAHAASKATSTNESTQVDEKAYKMSDDDHARVAYHTQMASEHKQKADHHYHEGKSYDDAHRKASLYHNGAAAEHEYAVRAYKTGAANKEEYTAHAKSRTSLAHAHSQKANG